MAEEPVQKDLAEAIQILKGSHIQDNKHRLGALGSQDIDNAVAMLENYYKGWQKTAVQLKELFDNAEK